MKQIVQFSPLAAFALIAMVVFPQPAHAYLDPGTGSVILQVVMAGILGALFTAKTWWRSVKAFFSRKSGAVQTDQNHEG